MMALYVVEHWWRLRKKWVDIPGKCYDTNEDAERSLADIKARKPNWRLRVRRIETKESEATQ